MTESDPSIHFLAGVSRSGITWLSRALNLHPEVAVFGQSRFWGRHYIEPDGDGLYQAAHLDRLVAKIHQHDWNATIGDDVGCFDVTLGDFRALLTSAVREASADLTPKSAFVAMASAVASIKGARLVIEKTPHHVLHTDRIHQAFPKACLLCLTCDAPTHMAVLKSQPDLLYHPAAAALIWRTYRRAIELELRSRPERSMRVECAALAIDSSEQLRAIGEFLGLADFDWASGMPTYDHGVPNGHLPPLSSAENYWSAKFNGALGPAHLDWSVVASGLALPVFAVRNFAETLTDHEGSMLSYYRRWLMRRPT